MKIDNIIRLKLTTNEFDDFILFLNNFYWREKWANTHIKQYQKQEANLQVEWRCTIKIIFHIYIKIWLVGLGTHILRELNNYYRMYV